MQSEKLAKENPCLIDDGEMRKVKLDADEVVAWDMYFTSIAGWAYHPGYLKGTSERLSVVTCAGIADMMLRERRKRL